MMGSAFGRQRPEDQSSRPAQAKNVSKTLPQKQAGHSNSSVKISDLSYLGSVGGRIMAQGWPRQKAQKII
jgi:hypothetical protein